MYIETVPNRGSRPAILLREGWREDGKVKKRTLANLSDWPEHKVQALAAVLKGKAVVGSVEEAFDVVRSLPHGHVVAVVRLLQHLKLDHVLSRTQSPARALSVAMIASRIISPCSKLSLARGLADSTADSTLGELLGVQNADEEQCYSAMDWLLSRQSSIETALAQRHLQDGALVLYDVTSSYFEGRTCPLARFGHSRDGRRDKLQIVVGLLTNAEGCPVAVEVFDGNTGDPTTLAPQLEKLRQRFAISRLVMVGDRGMLTQARIREELSGKEGLDWITCLRAPAIAKLRDQGVLQPSLFDERDMAEVVAEQFPGERLVVCRNPFLAEERGRKREDLLRATERELERVCVAVRRAARPLRGQDQIGLRVGKSINRFKVRKHFAVTITDNDLRWERNEASIAAEAALDGIYVVRTTVPGERMPTSEVVRSYKRLANVERAFRSMKTVDLRIRPIRHRTADRVRAHVLLCMLAYYVEWHMRRALAPILFDDDDPEGATAARNSIVAPAHRSTRAEAKALTKRTSAGHPVHSFQSLLGDLSTIAKNRVQPRVAGTPAFDLVTKPTPLQQHALQLLGVQLLP